MRESPRSAIALTVSEQFVEALRLFLLMAGALAGCLLLGALVVHGLWLTWYVAEARLFLACLLVSTCVVMSARELASREMFRPVE